ncbi:methionyl-tRNA formyltransferase [Erythrobacter dokdonensis]|uniref:Methionyl-tRNA formyltransferase n=1 Tax=Erythrobacter dokdonensis DSW-74 TaxID=1300349 RepID=A0A1A7BFY9_9SPHN|nr:methionyl-tRNA formyltransferase [Erythrobacter dokdonensis]OBV11404.1 Methionyl-tRNA formyltransferase [Erythrobacter dokdonensis DSW-74]
MRIIFMGTPEFAVPALRALHEAGHEVVCAYTQPPRPAGRGKKLMPSPVQMEAERLGVPVRAPVSLRNAEAQAEFAALNADVAVVAAYGLILPQPVLDAPRHGCLNIHASLLPRWRGAAPIHRAVMAGDAQTGVTIMRMEAGLDTGPMLHKVTVPVGRKTTGELFAELGAVGAAAMVEVLSDLSAFPPQAQDDAAAIYAPKIDKAESRIDWMADAGAIERLVRGLAPFPGAWFALEGERIKVLLAEVVDAAGAPGTVCDDDFTIACGQGAIRPLRLQRAGKPAMACEEFLRGRPVAAGTVLG